MHRRTMTAACFGMFLVTAWASVSAMDDCCSGPEDEKIETKKVSDLFGHGVSVSGDVAVVSAPWDDLSGCKTCNPDLTGAVYVYFSIRGVIKRPCRGRQGSAGREG